MKQRRRIRAPEWKGVGSRAREKECVQRKRNGERRRGKWKERRREAVQRNTGQGTLEQIEVPGNLSAGSNHDEVATFVKRVERLTEGKPRDVSIETGALRSADTGGLVILSATMQALDEESKSRNGAWRVQATEESLDPNIARLFSDFGVFGFKGIHGGSVIAPLGITALKIQRGRDTEGDRARWLLMQRMK